MKKSILTIAFCGLLMPLVAIFSGCQTSEKKLDQAQTEAMKANEALDKANKEYLADVENYRKERTEMMAKNDQSIEDLKAKIANEKKDVKADYEKKITELEQKNKDLKAKINDYKDNGKEQWESFKQEFNHDMDELGKALKDLTVNNKK